MDANSLGGLSREFTGLCIQLTEGGYIPKSSHNPSYRSATSSAASESANCGTSKNGSLSVFDPGAGLNMGGRNAVNSYREKMV